MSEIKLMILPSVLKERTGVHTNIDDKLIMPEIKAAQDLYIRPLLGSILFDKMLTDLPSSLSGDYLYIFEQFIIDALCNYVMSELPEGLNYQFWNKGLSSKTTDDSQNPTMSEMYSIVSKYKKRAEHYADRCRLWLIQNAPSRIPEYYAPGGVDKVSPDRQVFTSPIYLGGSGGIPYTGPNRDPSKNSNDPEYL